MSVACLEAVQVSNETTTRPLTEIERGIYCHMRGDLPPDDASGQYWSGFIMWSLWRLGVPGELEA